MSDSEPVPFTISGNATPARDESVFHSRDAASLKAWFRGGTTAYLVEDISAERPDVIVVASTFGFGAIRSRVDVYKYIDGEWKAVIQVPGVDEKIRMSHDGAAVEIRGVETGNLLLKVDLRAI